MSVPLDRVLLSCCGLLVAGAALAGCSAGVTGGDAGSDSASPRSGGPSGSHSSSGSTTSSASDSPAGGGTPASGGGIVPSVVVPDLSGLPSGVSTGTSAGTTSIPLGSASLPTNFPVPPGASVSGVTRDGGEIAGRISLPDGTRAYQFWKQALPKAGYPVSEAQAVGGYGEIRFSGHGCSGDSQIALAGNTATVQCDLG